MHNIQILTFKNGTSDRKIGEKLDDIVNYNHGDYREPIRSSCRVFNSYDNAYNWLMEQSDCYCVQYKTKAPKYKKEYYTTEERLKEVESKIEELEKPQYKNIKSQYIACKHCGSKLATRLLRSNECPLCFWELRSQTMLDKLSALESKRSDLRSKLRELGKEPIGKKDDMEIMVKLDYHT